MWSVGRDLAKGDAFAYKEMVASLGPDLAAREAHALVDRTVREDQDPVLRVATLALAERLAPESKTEPTPYASEAYTNLKERPGIEAEYLLRAYEQSPLKSAETVREVESVVKDSTADLNLRRTGVRALGAAGATKELDAFITGVERAGGMTQDGAIEAIGPALGRCGQHCEGTMVRLAQGQAPNSRLALLVALGQAKESEVADVATRVLPYLERGSLSPMEADQLAFVKQRLGIL